MQGDLSAAMDAVQCFKTCSHCVLVEQHEEKQIKGYGSSAFFIISL